MGLFGIAKTIIKASTEKGAMKLAEDYVNQRGKKRREDNEAKEKEMEDDVRGFFGSSKKKDDKDDK